MSARIRVALVGLGRMGRNWLRTLEASPRFDVVAVVDPVAPDATAPSLAGLPAVDAAIVATPTPTHADVAGELLSRGIPLLVEKPLAGTYAECLRLDAQARSAGVPLAVGHIERFNPAVRALLSAVKEGRIGDVLHVSAIRAGTRPACVAPGNNVALDLAVHDLDLIRLLLGPLRVKASDGGCDVVDVLLRSRGGAGASVHANWITPAKIRALRVTGSRGMAMLEFAHQTLFFYGERGEEAPIVREEPLTLQAEAFARMVNTGYGGSLCSAEDAGAAVLLAERALSGAVGGEWV